MTYFSFVETGADSWRIYYLGGKKAEHFGDVFRARSKVLFISHRGVSRLYPSLRALEMKLETVELAIMIGKAAAKRERVAA